VDVGNAFGSQVIQSHTGGTIGRASGLILVAVLGATFALIWRRRRTIGADPRLMPLACLATMLGSLVGSKVLSPQYFIWIIPAVALGGADRKLLGTLLAGALLLTQVLFPAFYWKFARDQSAGAIVLVLTRNLLVVVGLGMSLWYLWRLPADAPDAEPEAEAA
jgi:hypothetical protein